MANQSPIQTLSSAQISQGFPIYNEYADIFLRPDVRQERILRGNMPNFLMYIFDQRLNLLGAGHREVTTRKYMWEEILSNKLSYNFTTAVTAAGSAGADVACTVSAPTAPTGTFVPPVGAQCFTNIAGVIVQATVKASVNGTVTLNRNDGAVLDLSAKKYIWQFDPNVTYQKACSGNIAKNGFTQTQPNIGHGVIQEYENGKTICQDAISHYGHDNIPTPMRMLDTITGQEIDTFCLRSGVQQQIANDMMYGQFIQMMIGSYNMATDSGTDGLLTSVARRGKFNMTINSNNYNSIVASLTAISKRFIREGITSATIWCDQEMYSNLNKAAARIVGTNNYNLPIWGGDANGWLNWYGFGGIKNFLGLGFDFKFARFTGWEQMDYDRSIMRNFALLIPDMTFNSSTGGKIPNMEIVKLKGCDGMQVSAQNGTNASIWYDDTRVRGGRTLDVYARNQFGFDIHGVGYFGLINGNAQQTTP